MDDDSASSPLLARYRLIVYSVLALAIGAGVFALLASRPEPASIAIIPPEPTAVPSATPIPSTTPTPGPFLVYITGAVERPNVLVTLDYGSRVIDALNAAGGSRIDANLDLVNLAQRLADGDQIHVPTLRAQPGQVRVTVHVVTPTPGMLVVYVTGAVRQPGRMVTLAAGSRVSDAIDAAGGLADDADAQALNLSARLNDGDLVHVPSALDDNLPTPTPNHPPLIHINDASAEELVTLPGIGPALAQAIIEHRTRYGPFKQFEDLDAVPGLGPAKLEAIREQVIID
jgi:competence protein ComEA